MAALAFGALLSVVTYRQAVQMTPVLALARPVAAGHLVQADDLRVVHVRTEGGVETVSSGDSSGVIGRVAAVTLARGTLLSPSHLQDPRASLHGATAVVGLTLKDGQLPVSLRPGDLVSLVDTGDAARRPASTPEGAALNVLVDTATVFATPTTSATGTVVVSVAVARDVAAKVATAAAAGRISLVYLPPDAE